MWPRLMICFMCFWIELDHLSNIRPKKHECVKFGSLSTGCRASVSLIAFVLGYEQGVKPNPNLNREPVKTAFFR